MDKQSGDITGCSITRIEDDVFQITAGRSNTFLICGTEPVLIDTGMKPDGDKILKAVETRGVRPEDISLILITHAHIDHTGGLAFLKRSTGAKTAAPALERDYIEGRKKTWTMARKGIAGMIFRLMLFVMETAVFRYTPSVVDMPLSGGETVDVSGGIEVVAAPGHSPGSLGYYLREKKILFTGDALTGVPEPGLPVRFGCSDYAQALKSAAALSGLVFDTCCFGHGAALRHDADRQIRQLVKGINAGG